MIARRPVLAGLMLFAAPLRAWATPEMWPVADLSWRFIADRVMGGVSNGEARIENGALHLTGTVSTANNGGFIQVRADVSGADFAGTSGLRLRVRGDGQRYFIHLRTTDSRRPWHFYQAAFETQTAWTNIDLPYTAFDARGRGLPERLDPGRIETVALVAYGRDHTADVMLSALGPV